MWTNKVTLWVVSYSACVVYTKTIIHLSVCESGIYLPPLWWIIVKYPPIFRTVRIAKKIWRIINTIASFWGEKYARIFVLGHYLFLVAHIFLKLHSQKTVHFSEKIMSADKYPSIFLCQMEGIVYISFTQHDKKKTSKNEGYADITD